MDSDQVLERVRAGEMTLRAAAAELGCSFSWVRYLADPVKYRAKLEWEAHPKRRAAQRDRYYGMSGVAYNRLLLGMRRRRALRRMAERDARRGEGGSARV